MLDKIIAFSIKNKIIVGMMTLVLIITGVWSATKLPIDVIPDISNNQVQIITTAPSLGAQEVEQFITAPIEMATGNIDNVIEKRSISRSGLSVVTLVFTDKTDIYWARGQVNIQLKEVESKIPKGMGEPMLAPITTGLGEIYHYVVHAKPGYEDKYSATDLRTIQDWIIKRQMAGVEGLAEVSGWGGFVKQYEIALDNERLNAMNINITEIYEALENNNENTGGSYIEQQNNAYFIRGLGQVKSIADIEKIVIKNIDGLPVLIRDVATVQFGSATRYGAVTRNGQGEAVSGVTLMLKGENFSQVSKNVKERMALIQKTLPEGVVIEPFIDRSELVGRAIKTVEKNLLEGGLIVVFVLVLLLGNWRASLVVASVIPLSMLFALSMMRLFGVSGNLMSLGAIDFGLIVDGAVIIVEAIVYRITMSNRHHLGIKKLSKAQMDTEVYAAASKIRTSAAFGEIIILIVYLPILALAGIEGKMFIPMAQTVGFAILGAFILSLTYVPMISALCLSRKTTHKRNFSDKLMDFFQRMYAPVLNLVLRFKKVVVLLFLALFIFSLWVFRNTGGEFIPTLEEGDLTVEITMMQGASLSQVVQTFSKAESVLKKKFPEIRQIVTRIGSAEIPTDPMPIERGDMMLQMKPKGQWTSAKTREQMQEMIEEELSVIPGINVEVTQPMQMRFNELMTGIRQDVAVKIFGDDLDELARQANVVGALIAPVRGVTEPTIEKSTGLPQIVVEYNRDKIAQYGLTISDVNMVLSTAFAGNVAGVVFEGEMRFDMVVRLKRDLRENILNIERLYVPLPSGSKVPLNQFADIKIVDAPAQVSRENGKRRVYVGFNVRGRDVQSLVEEIQTILDQKLKLPPGYYITYGGQFQNLKQANKRLAISVPIALALILVLLYFTFNSIKQTMLIFTAIPLSAIGGIFALWIRGMPFSISAGVGFIALFGVAVLNGIVLIGEFNFLKKEGVEDIYERVRRGTKHRLRPVIMTASVAALGFFPMAFSTGAGAEVQKPLATVVIGGLISATLLTLIVLPALYILFAGKTKLKMKPAVIAMAFLLIAPLSFAQKADKPLTLDDAINIALKNNPQIRSAKLDVDQQTVLKKTSFDLPKTNFSLVHGQYNSSTTDNNFEVTQELSFPTVYARQNMVQKQNVLLSQKYLALTQNELIRNVKTIYYQLSFSLEKLKLLSYQDSVYRRFSEVAQLKYKTGETSSLEMLSAKNKFQEIQLQRKLAEADIRIYQQEMQNLLAVESEITIASDKLEKLAIKLIADTSAINQNPLLAYYNQRITAATSRVSLEKSKFLPDLSVGYFNQSLDAVKGFQGVRFGVGIPIFSGPQKARVQSAKIQTQIAQSDYEFNKNTLITAFNQQLQEYQKYEEALRYYETAGLAQAEEILKVTQLAYTKGEIGYVEYIQNLTQAISIKSQYFEALNQFNQTIIRINYLTGGK